MCHAALVVGLVLSAVGLAGVLEPSLYGLVRRLLGPLTLWIATFVRVALGVALLLGAPETRLPGVVAAVGALLVAAGIVLPVAGLARLERIADRMLALPPAALRLVGAGVATLGGLVVWAGLG